jgi:hypothetical protein
VTVPERWPPAKEAIMKRLLLLAGVCALGFAGPSKIAASEEKTLQGEAMCAKCELKEAKSCQAAIRVKNGDKSEVYYAEQNKVAKDFHKHICTQTAKVVATGQVKEVDGKKHIALSKIELADK